PGEVAEALDYYKERFENMTVDSMNLTLMAIPFSTVHGPALILKNFAKKHPKKYLHALVSGYRPVIDVEKEVARMIKNWLNKPYVGDVEKDIQDFAKMVVAYFKSE